MTFSPYVSQCVCFNWHALMLYISKVPLAWNELSVTETLFHSCTHFVHIKSINEIRRHVSLRNEVYHPRGSKEKCSLWKQENKGHWDVPYTLKFSRWINFRVFRKLVQIREKKTPWKFDLRRSEYKGRYIFTKIKTAKKLRSQLFHGFVK